VFLFQLFFLCVFSAITNIIFASSQPVRRVPQVGNHSSRRDSTIRTYLRFMLLFVQIHDHRHFTTCSPETTRALSERVAHTDYHTARNTVFKRLQNVYCSQIKVFIYRRLLRSYITGQSIAHSRRACKKKTSVAESASELYRPSYSRLSAKLVPRGYRDGSLWTYSRISRQEPLLFLSSSPSVVLTRLSGPR
jgi:hypothetical protein